MRTFTRKERKYMAKLAARNIEETFKRDKEGLDNPMSAKERMMRLRIRKKSKIAMWDLNVAEVAGIIKSNKIMSDTYKILFLDLNRFKDERVLIAYSGLKYLNDTTYEEMASKAEQIANKGYIKLKEEEQKKLKKHNKNEKDI